MPKTTKQGDARQSELPSTLQHSDAKAQRTFAKAHDSAADEYGDEQRANRVAYSALKHTHEKVGDHWEPKDQNGPSDKQAEGGRDTNRETAGGWTRTPPRSTCKTSRAASTFPAARA